MKLKQTISCGIAAVVCAALLAGCGGASSAAPASQAPSAAASTAASAPAAQAADVGAVSETILAANPISNPFTVADLNLQLDYQLDAANVVSFTGVRSNDDNDAGTVLVLQAADGQAATLTDALTAYCENQALSMTYAEQEQEKANMENAIIQAKGDLVVLAVASNECTDTAALQAAVDSALA